MAAGQMDQRPRVFISYSRVDSEFAYRLRADLEASGFATWIDTAKLGAEGGQEWMRVIQDAVDFSQAMVVVISPDSVQSKYVHMEYHRAQSQNKLVIPLHFRTVTSAPMDLDLTQWLEFRDNHGGPDTYQTGLTNLIRSLARAPQPPKLPPLPQAPTTSAAPLTISEGADMPEFRPVTPAPPELSPDVLVLIAAVFDARGRNDLASEEYFLRKVVESKDARVGPDYAKRLRAVTSQMEQQRVARLRELAAEAVGAKQWRRALGAWQALLTIVPNDREAKAGAHQARAERAKVALHDGEFDEAVGTWQALLKADPSAKDAQDGLRSALRARAEDAWSKADWASAAESWETLRSLTPPEPDAQEYLDAIIQSQREAYRYQLAQRLIASGNAAAGRAALEDLYKAAPYYGDPAGLAPQIGIQLGKNLSELQREPIITAEERRWTQEAHKGTEAAVTTEKSKADNSEGWFTAWFITVIILGPSNYLSTAIASAMQAGDWWTGMMLANSFKIAWMPLLLCAVLFFPILMVSTLVGEYKGVLTDVRMSASLFFTSMLGIPGCWVIAEWLYNGFNHGVNWVALGIVAGAGVGGMILGVAILIIIGSTATWLKDLASPSPR